MDTLIGRKEKNVWKIFKCEKKKKDEEQEIKVMNKESTPRWKRGGIKSGIQSYVLQFIGVFYQELPSNGLINFIPAYLIPFARLKDSSSDILL